MKSLIFGVLTVSAMAVVGIDATPAKAEGFAFHVAGPGYHVDLGRGHRRHSSFYGNYGNPYRSHRGWHGHHRWHDDHVWHDTSHWDYHPGGYARHYDHYDYVPGHWDFHPEGHWDHYHW